MTTAPPNPNVLRRQALRTLAMAINGTNGWSDERENLYVRLTNTIPPDDLTQACRDLATTWTTPYMPPAGEIIQRAHAIETTRARTAAEARHTQAETERGIRRTEFDIDAPLCPRCGGGLMWLTDTETVYCHPCNGVIVWDSQTGRTRMNPDECNQLRVAQGPPGRHMRYGPNDHGPGRHLHPIPGDAA